MSISTITNDLNTILPRADQQDLGYLSDGSLGDHTNLFIGIGMCSYKNGLSVGLPVDIMQMLIPAAVIRHQLSSRIKIIIADSMVPDYLKEGVEKVTQLYQDSLKPLLQWLKIDEYCDITLMSELEKNGNYQKELEKLSEQSETIDADHYKYVRQQTAIISYMHHHEKAGIKIGWIHEKTDLKSGAVASSIIRWNEHKFDKFVKELLPQLPMRYIYTRAGIANQTPEGKLDLVEHAPYASYPRMRCRLINVGGESGKVTLAEKRESKQWSKIREICQRLIQAGVVAPDLLPQGMEGNNEKLLVGKMLRHWAHPPKATSEAADA